LTPAFPVERSRFPVDDFVAILMGLATDLAEVSIMEIKGELL
jgi:hypothetical protein